jgi:hypothetical protein
VDIVVFPFFFPCDLGVIIPIGRGGLCKTSKRHYSPCNSIGIGPTKILCLNPVIFIIYYVVVNIVHFFHYFDLGMKIPNGIGGFR